MPVGPALVAAHAARAGHEVRLTDLMFERDPERAAREAIASFRPEVIGVGMRNIDNSDLIETKYYVPDVERILFAVRKAAPHAPIVLGGAATSIEPEALLALWGPAGAASRRASITTPMPRDSPKSSGAPARDTRTSSTPR